MKLDKNTNFLNNILLGNLKLIFIYLYIYSLYSLLSYFLGLGKNFSFFRILKLESTFEDLRMMTHNSECDTTIDLIRAAKEFI